MFGIPLTIERERGEIHITITQLEVFTDLMSLLFIIYHLPVGVHTR